jgi:hypothetical protein
VVGLLVGVSLVVGAVGGYRVGLAVDRQPGVSIPAATVAAPGADSVSKMAAACASSPQHLKFACYRALLDDRIVSGGVGAALETLRDLTKSDPDVERDVHMYAHGIGIDAYRHQPDMNATFSHCTPEFSSGCYHGVLQAYFDLRGTADPAVVRGACELYEGSADKQWLLFQCLHGMGHGLDMALGHNLPKALAACDLLAERWHRESCYGGAFMENIVHVTVPDHPATLLAAETEHSKTDGMGSMASMHMDDEKTGAEPAFRAIDSTDPQYPCSIVADRYGPECYRIQTALMLYLDHGSMTKTAHECDQAPTKYRPQCYESLGRDISSYANYETAPAVRLCTVGTLSLRRYCYTGAAESFVDNRAKPDDGFAVCAAIPSAQDRPTCYERMGELILALSATNAGREQLCTLPSPSATQACRKGARLPAT